MPNRRVLGRTPMGHFFSSMIPHKEEETSHPNIHVITSRLEWDSKLSEATSSGKIVVVDFTASWCGPCQFIAPYYAELSDGYPHLMFLKVDVDQLQEVCTEWEVSAMPTFIFIKDGKAIDKIVGVNKGELLKKVAFHAGSAQ